MGPGPYGFIGGPMGPEGKAFAEIPSFFNVGAGRRRVFRPRKHAPDFVVPSPANLKRLWIPRRVFGMPKHVWGFEGEGTAAAAGRAQLAQPPQRAQG